jgi:hypothetical protein
MELRNVHRSPNILEIMKYRSIRCAANGIRMGRGVQNVYRETEWETTTWNSDEMAECSIYALRKWEVAGTGSESCPGEGFGISGVELQNLYSSLNIIRVIKARRLRWAGHVARIGEGRSVYRVLVGKPECKRPLGRPGSRWEDNIKMDLREIGIHGVNWIRLAQNRVQ